MKELYDDAVNPCDMIHTLYNNIDTVSEHEMEQIKFQMNSDAVKTLISF